jgi:hypothetical protein
MSFPAAFACAAIVSLEGMNRRMEDAMLPPAYYLDESDPDIITLRRKDHTFVAAFSAQGATREGIIEAAMQDSRNPEAARPPYDVTAPEGEDS